MKIAAMAFLCGRQNATTCTALHSLPDSPVQLSRNSDVLAQGLMSGAPDCSLLEQRGITGLERAIERFKENVAAREFMPSHFGASLTSGNEIGLSNCFGEVMQGFPVYSPPSFQSLVLPSHPHAQTQLPHDTSVIPMSCMDASKAHLSSLTVTMHSCPVESSEPLTPHPQFSPTHAGGFEFSWKASFISSSHNPPPPLPRCNPNVLSPECKPPKSIFTRNSTSGTHKKVEWLPQLQNAQGPFSVEPISAPLMCMEQLEPYITHDDVSAHRPLNNGNSHHSSKELAAMEAQLVFDQANTSTMQPFQMPMYNHSTCNENDGEHSPADDLLVSLSSSNSTTGQNIQAISSVEDSFSKYSDIPVDSTDVIHHDHFHDSEQRGYLASNTSTGRMSMDSRITGREQGLISANTSLAPPPVFGEVFPNSAVNFAPTGPHYMFLPVVPPMAQMCFPPRHGDFSPMSGELCQSMLPHSNGLRRKGIHFYYPAPSLEPQ